jgi:transposase
MGRKVKYNYEFKLQCVNEVLENHQSISYVANKYQICDSLLKKWIRYYKKFGEESLVFKPGNARYDGDFKLKVVLYVKQKSISLAAACLKYNIPSVSTLMSWMNKYNQYGSKVLFEETRGKSKKMNFKKAKKKSTAPLTKEEQLLKENEALRCEIALLKKFNALIQAKELQQQKRLKP